MKKLFLLVLAIGALAAGAVWWFAFSSNVGGTERHSVRIPEGTGFEAALDSLESADALANRSSMELFGRPPKPHEPPSKANLPRAFHVYSMRQAI